MVNLKYNYTYSPSNPLRQNRRLMSANQGETRFLVGLMILISLIVLTFLVIVHAFPKFAPTQNGEIKKPITVQKLHYG